tara:strand:- start:55 stop:957 length:903 start_codon:yes stop_codon:yes gene_type:complete
MKENLLQMEDIKNPNHQEEFPDNKIDKEAVEIKNEEHKLIPNLNNELNVNKNLQTDHADNSNNIRNNQKRFEDKKNIDITDKANLEIEKTKNNLTKVGNEIIKGKQTEEKKVPVAETNLDELAEITDKVNNKITKDKKLEDNNNIDSKVKLKVDINKTQNISKQIPATKPEKEKTKPVKELPIEKKPFLIFVNDYLIPEIKNEFKLKGKEVNKINLQKTNRPIAEDICWVIYCEIKDTCNFWLSFQKDDITSLKSFSLCKNYEKPSIIESFLIDEKKITLKLIISRILQRLNGQKLIGAN